MEKIGIEAECFRVIEDKTRIASHYDGMEGYAAEHAGEIMAFLSMMGTRIGEKDTMIAGHARSLGLTLITNNTREFERVPGLQIDDWLER